MFLKHSQSCKTRFSYIPDFPFFLTINRSILFLLKNNYLSLSRCICKSRSVDISVRISCACRRVSVPESWSHRLMELLSWRRLFATWQVRTLRYFLVLNRFQRRKPFVSLPPRFLISRALCTSFILSFLFSTLSFSLSFLNVFFL